jgi:hypothetical protein
VNPPFAVCGGTTSVHPVPPSVVEYTDEDSPEPTLTNASLLFNASKVTPRVVAGKSAVVSNMYPSPLNDFTSVVWPFGPGRTIHQPVGLKRSTDTGDPLMVDRKLHAYLGDVSWMVMVPFTPIRKVLPRGSDQCRP